MDINDGMILIYQKDFDNAIILLTQIKDLAQEILKDDLEDGEEILNSRIKLLNLAKIADDGIKVLHETNDK